MSVIIRRRLKTSTIQITMSILMFVIMMKRMRLTMIMNKVIKRNNSKIRTRFFFVYVEHIKKTLKNYSYVINLM